jgi:hypothetical protein
VRRKAALKIAEFLLPKAGKKAKVIPDEYGFSINPNLASAYREIQRELRALMSGPARKIPAIAEKIKKLEARSDAIRRRFQVPCPTKYGDKEAAKDIARLIEFASLREDGTALTEAQKAEEAHLRARLDVFNASPEHDCRRAARRWSFASDGAERSRDGRRTPGGWWCCWRRSHPPPRLRIPTLPAPPQVFALLNKLRQGVSCEGCRLVTDCV